MVRGQERRRREKTVVRGQWSGKTEISGQGKRLPVAKELGETSLMFKVHPTLTKENMHYVVEQVMGVLNFKC